MNVDDQKIWIEDYAIKRGCVMVSRTDFSDNFCDKFSVGYGTLKRRLREMWQSGYFTRRRKETYDPGCSGSGSWIPGWEYIYYS